MNKNQKIKWLLTASTLTLPLISVACTKNTDNQSQPINKTNDEELLLQELNSEVENSQLEFNEAATQEEKNNFVKTPNDFRSLIKKRRKFKNTKFKLLIKSIFLENDQVIVEFSVQDKETQKESKILKKVFSSNDFFEKFNNKNLSIQSIEKEKKKKNLTIKKIMKQLLY
ncbi:hypothetical protein MCSF7_02821 [Mycoplasmopsis columbina SF7]|uniref:Lipoprotein n=1 Tax=Mycoplasmopsis columbina SF7 TaxID=1037410 RepID=F9UJA6_9BACT|nr:hypothetical protein [Mycoplasmopsis columbina]EGV00525.1 hypothetical protein MCSF7_02821 [Mycoplasmopsis columbina SF7]